jgi:predicted Zn-dependent peptidase
MRVIDDGMSTRLYHRLCDARGLCYDVSAGYDGYEDDGIIDVAAGVQHKRVALVAGEILSMFGELAREGPTPEELHKAKRRIAWDARALVDSAEETSAYLAGGLLFDRFCEPEQRVHELTAVSGAEVQEVAQRIAQPDRLNVVAVGLLEDGEEERLESAVRGWSGSAAPSARLPL